MWVQLGKAQKLQHVLNIYILHYGYIIKGSGVGGHRQALASLCSHRRHWLASAGICWRQRTSAVIDGHRLALAASAGIAQTLAGISWRLRVSAASAGVDSIGGHQSDIGGRWRALVGRHKSVIG